MLEFSTTPPKDAPPRPRETLFTIDGKPYTVPTAFEPLEMARYAFMVSEWGGDAAAVWALQLALGNDEAITFMNLPYGTVTKEQWIQVVGLVTGRLVGLDVALPKGPAAAASVLADTAPESPAEKWTPPLEPPDSEVWPDREPSEGPTQPTPET